MALLRMKKNPKRNTRNPNISYREESEDSLPYLAYKPPKNKTITAIKQIGFPEYHHDDDEDYYIPVSYWNDNDIEYYPIKTACNKFIGNDKTNEPSVKQWLLLFKNTKYMTPHLWDCIQKSITVTVTPKHPIGAVSLLINDNLPSVISYVVILAHNKNNFCHFDEVDDLLLYLVQHIDVRSNSFKRFFKTTGKEFDLVRPKGWVTESKLLRLTSMKYIGMPDIVWMEARLHYYQILSETLAQKSEIVTELFMTTINVLLNFIGTRIRGTLHLRNEGKIKSFTFHVAKPIIDTVLNKKFREVKKLKRNEKFKKFSSSTIYIFNHAQAETVLPEEYCNRDFNENGIEIFPDTMDDDEDEDNDLSYTMSLSALVFRFYHNSEKIVAKHNPVRIDHNDHMTGQQLDFWQSYKSKFDEKDFKDIVIPSNE